MSKSTGAQGRQPRRRGIDCFELFAERPQIKQTWARSSRDGIAYQGRRTNYVSTGAKKENTLARVALRDLSLETWTEAKGRQHGLQVRPSDAGRRAALLATMLEDRQAYTDLFGGPLLPALQGMLPTSTSGRTAYPQQQGVVLGANEGVLNFAGLSALCARLNVEELRERVDAACRAGVLRRGLVLRCATCEQKQFLPIGKIDQRWPCQRCDASNDLNQWAWKAPADEPVWFFDLHPVGRRVLRETARCRHFSPRTDATNTDVRLPRPSVLRRP